MTRNDLLQAAMHCHSLGYQVIPLCTPSSERKSCLPHGLIEVREVPSDLWLGPPGLHKWKDRAIKRRRGREAQTYAAVASGNDDMG